MVSLAETAARGRKPASAVDFVAPAAEGAASTFPSGRHPCAAKAGSRSRGFLLGGVYGAAMALVYGVLGVIVITTASTFGTINASPWFNVAIAVVFVVLAYWMNDVFELVSKPLRDALPEGSEMIVTDVAAPFLTPMKTAFFVALFIAMPVVLFQAWQFVAPGLYKREKRLAVPLLLSSIALFYAGIAFAYFIVFKVMFGFFARVVPGGVQMSPDISAYLSFVLGVFLYKLAERRARNRGLLGQY